jgi:hypothetical protein
MAGGAEVASREGSWGRRLERAEGELARLGERLGGAEAGRRGAEALARAVVGLGEGLGAAVASLDALAGAQGRAQERQRCVAAAP